MPSINIIMPNLGFNVINKHGVFLKEHIIHILSHKKLSITIFFAINSDGMYYFGNCLNKNYGDFSGSMSGCFVRNKSFSCFVEGFLDQLNHIRSGEMFKDCDRLFSLDKVFRSFEYASVIQVETKTDAGIMKSQILINRYANQEVIRPVYLEGVQIDMFN